MPETRSNAPLATPKPELAVVARLAGVAVALLGGVMLLLALAAAWRISQHAAHTRDRILPNILDNQRTIVNVERLQRFAELAHVSTDRQTRRAALHTAEALAQAMSFESDARLADTVKAVFKNLRAMARQKDEQDRLKENMELLGRDIEETGISMIKGLVAKSGRVTAPNPSECREPRAYLLSRRALEATDFSTPNSVRVAWNEFQVQQRDVQRSSRCLDDAAAADIPDPLAFVDRAAAMFVLRLEYLQTITNVDDLWRASTTSIEALSASLTVSAAKATADSFTAIEVKAQQAMLVLSVVIAGSFLLMLALRAFILRHILRPVRDASQALEAIERTGYSPALLPARIKEFDLVNRGVERLAVMIEQVAQRSHDLEAEIVERKRVEEKLRASEEDYRSIFANALTGIYRSRYSDGLFLEANDRAAQFFGYPSRESFVGKVRASDRYFDPEDRERFLAHLEAHGAVEHFEARFRRLDGSIGWILYSGKLHRERGYIEGVMTDITARKKAEEQLANLNHHLEDLVSARTEALVRQAQELEAANRRLLELDEMKSSFLSSVSHELRTPLTSIFGFVKLVLRDFERHFLPFAARDPALEPKGRRILDNLEIIHKEGDRLTRLVNNVLDLAKIESGRQEWSDREIELADCIAEAVQAVAGIYNERPELRLETEVPKGLPRLYADPDCIAQLCINLLHNAAKFTRAGVVRISAAALGQDRLRLCVEDCGSGIPATDAERIFDRFHQVRHTDILTDKPQGSGLGLAICKEIVTHYKGEIRVESEPGKGSVFVVELPALG